LSSHRSAPLLLQALRAGHRPSQPPQSDQETVGGRDEGSHPGSGRAGGDLREGQALRVGALGIDRSSMLRYDSPEPAEGLGTSGVVALRAAAQSRQQPIQVVPDGSIPVGEPVVTTILLPITSATAPFRGSGSGGSASHWSAVGS